jgi:MFS family permease
MFYEDVLKERAGSEPMDNNTSMATDVNNTSGGNTTSKPDVHYLDYEAPTNVEWLWSITVAIFVLFGMIGAFISGKWADYFGR